MWPVCGAGMLWVFIKAGGWVVVTVGVEKWRAWW